MKDYMEKRIAELNVQIAQLGTELIIMEDRVKDIRNALASAVGAKMEQLRNIEVFNAKNGKQVQGQETKRG